MRAREPVKLIVVDTVGDEETQRGCREQARAKRRPQSSRFVARLDA
jgi:hypothetical protein